MFIRVQSPFLNKYMFECPNISGQNMIKNVNAASKTAGAMKLCLESWFMMLYQDCKQSPTGSCSTW